MLLLLACRDNLGLACPSCITWREQLDPATLLWFLPPPCAAAVMSQNAAVLHIMALQPVLRCSSGKAFSGQTLAAV